MDLSQLSHALRSEILYPDEMKFVERGISGRGFYPGCPGFSSEKSPIGGLMLLGRDFGTKSYYESLLGRPHRDENSKTWERTCKFYLSLENEPSLNDLPVWCTNYLMGVRTKAPATGNVNKRISSSEWLKYETSCWDFLQKQVLLQRPAVVVVFGNDNRLDLQTESRFGKERTQIKRHTFKFGDRCHSATVAFADHPFSMISRAAQQKARREVARIRDLYLSAARNES